MNNNQTLIERALENMSGHQYTNLASTPHLEAWRCARPGSSIYAFDILITRYGIAVMGDIDNLTFRVGSSYGLQFLARDKVDGYMIGKLSSESVEYEIDWQAVIKYCAFNWFSLFSERISNSWSAEQVEELASDLRGLDLPTAWLDPTWPDSSGLHGFDSLADMASVVSQIDALDLDSKVSKHSMDSDHVDLFSLTSTLESLQSLGDSDVANLEFILCDAVYGASELADWSFTKYSESLLVRLHMINHAAKAIVAKMATSTPDNPTLSTETA